MLIFVLLQNTNFVSYLMSNCNINAQLGYLSFWDKRHLGLLMNVLLGKLLYLRKLRESLYIVKSASARFYHCGTHEC